MVVGRSSSVVALGLLKAVRPLNLTPNSGPATSRFHCRVRAAESADWAALPPAEIALVGGSHWAGGR
jgi:hypothetical protein